MSLIHVYWIAILSYSDLALKGNELLVTMIYQVNISFATYFVIFLWNKTLISIVKNGFFFFLFFLFWYVWKPKGCSSLPSHILCPPLLKIQTWDFLVEVSCSSCKGTPLGQSKTSLTLSRRYFKEEWVFLLQSLRSIVHVRTVDAVLGLLKISTIKVAYSGLEWVHSELIFRVTVFVCVFLLCLCIWCWWCFVFACMPFFLSIPMIHNFRCENLSDQLVSLAAIWYKSCTAYTKINHVKRKHLHTTMLWCACTFNT